MHGAYAGVRIVILTQYFPPEIGAPQTRLAAIAKELSLRGHTVEVVTAMPHHLEARTYDGYRGKWYCKEQIGGIAVHRSWVYAARGTGVRRMLSYLSFTLSSLFALAQTKRPDYVFVESPPLFLSVPGWLAARRHGARLIFNVADLWPDAVRELGVLRSGLLLSAAEWLEGWTYRRATLVNAVTAGIENDLKTRKKVPASKLRFLPNGVDVDRFSPTERSHALAERLRTTGRPVFLYAGTHGIAQGLHHVLDAAAMYPESFVVFVGSGGEKPGLMSGARQRGLKNVRFVDAVPLDDMPEYFSIACASIVPLVRSRLHEGARPSKLFASFASGVPVIYSGVGEGAALVRDADAGIVVEPENPAAMAQAMRTLAQDTALRRRMSVHARSLAVDRFAWSLIVERWLASL